MSANGVLKEYRQLLERIHDETRMALGRQLDWLCGPLMHLFTLFLSHEIHIKFRERDQDGNWFAAEDLIRREFGQGELLIIKSLVLKGCDLCFASKGPTLLSEPENSFFTGDEEVLERLMRADSASLNQLIGEACEAEPSQIDILFYLGKELKYLLDLFCGGAQNGRI